MWCQVLCRACYLLPEKWLPNNEIRDLTANLSNEVCSVVCIEPGLQSITREILTGATSNHKCPWWWMSWHCCQWFSGEVGSKAMLEFSTHMHFSADSPVCLLLLQAWGFEEACLIFLPGHDKWSHYNTCYKLIRNCSFQNRLAQFIVDHPFQNQV